MTAKNNINSLLESLIQEISLEVSERIVFTVEEYLKDKLASTPESQKLLIDSDEVAEQLSVSKSTIIKLRKQGLPTVYIGDSVRFEPKAVMQFIHKLKSKKDGQIE